MKIAVVGGIGSGKSSVMKLLSELGKRTCDCDEIYRQIAQNKEYIALIGSLFDVVKDGRIDKKALGDMVFSDGEKLKKLNASAHPLVFKKIDEIYREEVGADLFVEVSAFSLDMAKYFDFIVLVKSDLNNRIDRIKRRNNFKDDYILSIMNNQLCDEEIEKIAKFIIINDSDADDLKKKVEEMIFSDALK